MSSQIDQEMDACFMQLSEEEKRSVVDLLKVFTEGRQRQIGNISSDPHKKEKNESAKSKNTL